MNSSTLKEKGFSQPLPLKGLSFSNLPFNKGSVFVLSDITVAGKPTSDILYIGKSKKPTKRILGGYLAGYGGKTTRKISSVLFDDGFIDKVAVSWMLAENPKLAQEELLEGFKKEHGEYPAWNAMKKTPKNSKPAAQKTSKTRPTKKTAKPPASTA